MSKVSLLIKTDISFSELNHAFEQVLSQKIYYSSTVNDHLRKMVTNDVSVDQINGDALIVGSMTSVNTNSNFPKSYGVDDE